MAGVLKLSRTLNVELIKFFSFLVTSYFIYSWFLNSKGMTFLWSQRTLVLLARGSTSWVSFWSRSADVASPPHHQTLQKPNMKEIRSNEMLDGLIKTANDNRESSTAQSRECLGVAGTVLSTAGLHSLHYWCVIMKKWTVSLQLLRDEPNLWWHIHIHLLYGCIQLLLM